MSYSVTRRNALTALLAIFIQFGCTRSPKSTPAIDFEGASLNTMLSELSKYYEVKVCNPENLKGVELTAGFPANKPLEEILNDISYFENKRHVYLCLQNGVIFVGDKPFPENFVPNKEDWPCL